MNFFLKGGRVVDPSEDLDGFYDIGIKDGKIESVAAAGQSEIPENCELLDVTGKVVTPGLLDMHTHLREPGEEYKETLASGALAAVSGGFTAVACMPNTKPVNDNKSVTEFILNKAAQNGTAVIYPVGAITKENSGQSLAEFGDMKRAGIVALSDDGRPVVNTEVMRRALEYARNFDLPVISHCEDLALVGNGVMNEGVVSTQLGLAGIPAAAEEIMVFREIKLAELTGSSVHIAHVSTRGSVELIRRAKECHINVTAETAPHYFTLTEESVRGYNTNAKMNPPLRTEEDRLAVIQGLKDNVIDAIASDHAPHSTLEKDVEFSSAANGITGLETALPLSLALLHKNQITIQELVEKLSINPSRILRLTPNRIRKGETANLTVIDLDRLFTVDPKDLKSLSRNTPFNGWELKGKAVLTIIKGRVVYFDPACFPF